MSSCNFSLQKSSSWILARPIFHATFQQVNLVFWPRLGILGLKRLVTTALSHKDVQKSLSMIIVYFDILL